MDWVTRLSNLVAERTGIRMSATILTRTAHLLEARTSTLRFDHVRDYLEFIESADSKTEFETLVNMVTVGQTSFFRYPAMVDAIVNEVVPVLDAEVDPDATINIWSAACSTGEEPYSIAMALDEAGWFRRRPFRILATDINTESLDKARRGRYLVPRRGLPTRAQRYVRPLANDQVELVPDVHSRVAFELFNLSRPEGSQPDPWHVIVAANVFIYFEAHTIERTIDYLQSHQADTSVLFVGGTERIAHPGRLRLAQISGYYCYVRGRLEVFAFPVRPIEPRGDANPPPRTVDPLSSPAATHPDALVDTPAVLPDAPAGLDGESSAPAPSASSCMNLVTVLLGRGKRQQAIRELQDLLGRQPAHPVAARRLALLLFEDQRYEDAAPALEEALESDPLAVDLHFYLGWARGALGQFEAGQSALRRALFLEPDFSLARYEFALSLHKAGEYHHAAREYARARRDAGCPQQQRVILERANIPVETFWLNSSFVAELAAQNLERAQKGQQPVPSGRLARQQE